jgi:hypothetical protein
VRTSGRECDKKGSLDPDYNAFDQRLNLYFHAGPIYASANDDKTALQRFDKSTFAEEPPGLPIRWNAYAHDMIAFPSKELNRLKECREE